MLRFRNNGVKWVNVDALGLHALSCKRNAGRIQRHVYVNDLIYKLLVRAAVPAVKEPQGLVRVDGKRSDGLTLAPWQSGQCATWDVTVVDTLAASCVLQSAVIAASATEVATSRKKRRNTALLVTVTSFPVAIETLGPFSASIQIFLFEIGRRIAQRTSDPRETAFLFQRISVAIQRFNAVCMATTRMSSRCGQMRQFRQDGR
jgi:hypothetical protein